MTQLTFDIADEAETARLARDLAMALRPGDALLLRGPLGAGKSVTARAILRQLAGDEALEVPSPTYTLCQHYDLQLPVAHCDFYRLGSAQEASELGLVEFAERGVLIVEWPDNGIETDDATPFGTEAALVAIETAGESNRRITIAPWSRVSGGAIVERIGRSLDIRAFLDKAWRSGLERRFLQGDASTRRYEYVEGGVERRILMDAPKQPDGPPVRDSLPYSRVAHLAEDVRPFAAICQCLREAGYAAPAIHASDLESGLLLLDDLGEGKLVEDGRPIEDRYCCAARLLADMHDRKWPEAIPLADGTDRYPIPRYDRGAMMIEASLFADWYAPRLLGRKLDKEERDGFDACWEALVSEAQRAEATLVLRDYHSPNLIWRGDRAFPDCLGLIDFQDAVIGPTAYDLASLAQDARVDIRAELETKLVDHYLGSRRSLADAERFRRDYAIMAALRATKILGIFVRLDERDDKPAYLAHLPRLRDYLRRSLARPALARYREWLTAHGLIEG